jgi:hypothetical protein
MAGDDYPDIPAGKGIPLVDLDTFEFAAPVQEQISATFGTFVPATLFGMAGDGVTDNTAAFNAAMVALATKGGCLYFPAGVYMFEGTTNVVPGSVKLLGPSVSYSSPPEEENPSRGAVLRAGAAMARLIRIGSDSGSSSSAEVGASVESLTIDGNGLADWALVAGGRRNRVHDTYALRGVVGVVDWWGQNGEITGYTVFDAREVGDCIRIHGSPDNKILAGANFRSPGTTGACVHVVIDGADAGGSLASGNLLIQGQHMWVGANGVHTEAEALIWIQLTNNASYHHINILGNVLEGIIGPQIKVEVDSTSTLRGLMVEANTAFNTNEIPDATHPFVLIDGAGAVVDTIITGNYVKAASSTTRYKSLVHDAGTGSRARFILANNTGSQVQYPWTKAGSSTLAPEVGANVVLASDSVTRRTFDSGSATFTANGTATDFFIPTTLGQGMRRWSVTARNAGAAFRNWYAEVSGTQIKLSFVDGVGAPLAPASGTVLNFIWQAWE